MPLLGAFVADAYLGRYRTIAAFMALYILGLTLLTMSATVPPRAGGQNAAFFVALYLIAVGTGGIKPCVSSFGADPRERRSKDSYFNCVMLHEDDDDDDDDNSNKKLEHTEQFRWLGRAAIMVTDEDMMNKKLKNPWRVCTVTQVEELKMVVRLLPVWASGIVIAAV
ncbi:hypothetical protein PR202_ga28688 [Eleusine coracana subsp. coracana]|uniref:Uncharacterized protein n=1 Tax=Eleusine coracana subsp. coracana TaxID=191504 RepID=A0AAV5DJX2_ELECO|nr:hypothetical protein PR202_ga28688 [Eleusine coracana subsp. coracana]